jgi:hypothetical protein
MARIRSMRFPPIFALLLLPALAVLGQPVVGPEVLSDPLRPVIINYPVASPSVALARDRTGVVIAWMMPNTASVTRIYVARLDASAHIAGTVREIPVASTVSGIDAVYPSVAASVTGDGFTLAWTEATWPPVYAAEAVYCTLDAALQPSTPRALFGTSGVNTPSAIVRSGKTRTWITVNGLVWPMNADGSLQLPLDGGLTAGDMTVATDFPQLVGSDKVSHATCTPGCPYLDHHSWGCPSQCTTIQYTTLLKFTALYKTSGAVPFDFDSDAQPALQSDGHDILMAWYDAAQKAGGDVVVARLDPSVFDVPSAVKSARSVGTFNRDSGQTRPDIATDGQRYVVVWRTTASDGTHDVVGASIDANGKVTPFSVATSPADELDPSIISVGNGMFLVAYETFSDGVRRIAGRYVTFSSRPRAVR